MDNFLFYIYLDFPFLPEQINLEIYLDFPFLPEQINLEIYLDFQFLPEQINLEIVPKLFGCLTVFVLKRKNVLGIK